MATSDTSILFVCLGNICRSPLAEGVFRHLCETEGLTEQFMIDSCGTGSWHVGAAPHKGSQNVAKKHGILISSQKARQLSIADSSFDYVIAMDRQNREDIEGVIDVSSVYLHCLREFDEQADNLDVPDPYYTGGFQEVYEIIHRSCKSLLSHICEQLKYT